MKWMKPNAHTIWIKDGISQQMVGIHHHSRKHYQVCLYTTVFPKQ